MHYQRWRKHGDVQADRSPRCKRSRFMPCRQCGRPGHQADRRYCSEACMVAWRHANTRPDKRRLAESTRRDQAKKRAILQSIKLERGCADCGYRAHPAALDFDHRPGEVKVLNIGTDVCRAGLARLLAEAEKCDVVCANCHRVRTHRRLSASLADVADVGR